MKMFGIPKKIEPLEVCTVITKNYLSFARVLAHSLKQHHPESRLWVLLADRVDGCFKPEEEPFRWIFLEDLDDQEAVRRMSFYYNPYEFCCALRGELHAYMAEHVPGQKWLFLDSDILVCGSLQPVLDALEKNALLLSPHFIRPVPVRLEMREAKQLRYGVYNGGFLGLKKSETTKAFISWFRQRLKKHAFNDLKSSLFVDQLWLNYVPLFFKETKVLDHPGLNLARWNLIERALSKDNAGNIKVDGEPLLFCHFSDFSVSDIEKYITQSMRYLDSPEPVWQELCQIYWEKISLSGYQETRSYPYAFSRFVSGGTIKPEMRRLYYQDCAGGSAVSDPFENEASFTKRLGKLKPFWKGIGKRVMASLKGPFPFSPEMK